MRSDEAIAVLKRLNFFVLVGNEFQIDSSVHEHGASVNIS